MMNLMIHDLLPDLFFLNRAERFQPILQVDVCFLLLPPGFPAVLHYLKPVSVGPIPSQNRLSTSHTFEIISIIDDLVKSLKIPYSVIPVKTGMTTFYEFINY